MKRELERVEIPGESGARARTWAVLESAFEGRTSAPQKSHWPRVAAIAIALAAVLASAFSSPGRAVIDEIREVVGVETADRALFSLPTDGRLLVTSEAGVWVVQPDGSKRLLGDYREASWSPFGRFVVAARRNELAALEPDGDVRWTLARPGVRSPRWTGTESDTRIAYVDRSGIRVVAGDGTADRLLVPRFRGLVAWRPGPGFVLAYASLRDVVAVDATNGRTLWRRDRGVASTPTRVEWSSDGSRLVVLSTTGLRVFDASGRLVAANDRPSGDAAFRPGTNDLGTVQFIGSRSVVDSGQGVGRGFLGTGVFQDLAWSPGGRWYLVTWPTADQWVFVRADAPERIRAVANVSEQFRSRSFPRIEGWCCAP